MEQDNTSSTGPHSVVVGVKSWVAYLRMVFAAVILFGGSLLVAGMWSELVGGIMFVLSALFILICFLGIRSFQMYYDEVGVWMVSGFLPWTRGVTGVKWRDMDEATFEQGFWSWASQSYTVRVGHRYTKTSELVMQDVAKGKQAVLKLNEYQQNLIRERVIQ